MSELRKDTITGRWVIIYTDKENTPQDYCVEKHYLHGKETCPFCPGHENMTPPELDAIREYGTWRWLVRIVPNKFPALINQDQIQRCGVGLYDTMNAIGTHEIIIETPEHFKHFADFTDDEMKRVLTAYRSRNQQLQKDSRFRYILIFKNYGYSAGASLEHPHSQLIATPIIPKRVNEEIKGAVEYFEYKERCVFCDIIEQEKEAKKRVILQSEHFLVFCPFASSFPFETWIIPLYHAAEFSETSDAVLQELAWIMKTVFGKIRTVLRDPSFNFIIHTNPTGKTHLEQYHWHIEIMPRLSQIAGFEWGSGFYINRTSPEKAAALLKK